jgi:non-specific serine/threonine protein kinase/serine/threonine-protein kinase
MNEELLFAAALDKPTEAERRAFLDQACAGDVVLRKRVKRLLAAEEACGILDRGQSAAALMGAYRPEAPLAADQVFADRFRLRRKLGEGSMGEVWLAEQTEPVQRRVALKVIQPALCSDRQLARFAQERQALALMDHANIAKVLDAGVADGRPFFVMELIQGVPITEYCDRVGLCPRERLELFLPVCHAVQHAHQKGIIHRDLKPSNILVDEAGQPRVLDFGVARANGPDPRSSTAHTQTGQLLGTLVYMSPEQVAADPAALDERSDVYTLGVILFELLAGRLPYPVELLPMTEAARVIREQDPARLGAIDRRLRGDVETIVGRALEKDKEQRYPSAAELAADIRRHLRNQPIRARPPSRLYQVRKFVRRRKALVVATTASLALLLGDAAVLVVRLRDQVVQQARRNQEVHQALVRASGLREEARSAAGDPNQWAEARAEARRAGAVAASGPVDLGLTEQIAVLLRELNE